MVTNAYILGATKPCQKIGAFDCKDRRCIFRSFTCDDYYDCGYKSDELASYDTVCGMYSQLFSVNDVLY